MEAICLGHDLGHTPFGHLGESVLSEYLGRDFKHNEQSLRIVDHLERLNLTLEVREGILNHTWSMPLPSTLEAQVARYADRIAYLSHDIDDAIRAGMLSVSDLPPRTNKVLGETPSARIDTMVGSVVETSLLNDAVSMGAEVFEVLMETRSFMFENVYEGGEMKPEHEETRALLRALIDHFASNPHEIPGEGDTEIRLIDYVAGMTDRFAQRAYERLA